jgi:serine/threonine-protein kinase
MSTRAVAGDLTRLELEAAIAGRYELERELGRGGMGIVYLARDLALDRPIAIKVLPPQLAHVTSYRHRFLRETRTAAGLSHPHIVPIHAVEDREGLLYFVMGFVEGESLARRIARSGPLPVTEVVRVLREMGWALAYAHGRGVVHRDVKADNILLEHATGRALLADFGIARVADSSLTAPGASLGTPGYMSPEQVGGEPVDARSDIYSLGVVAFHALSGRLPFEGDTPQSVLAMHLAKPPPSVTRFRPDAAGRLAEVVDRCLLKDPTARWPTADALVASLPAATTSFTEVAPPVRNFHRAASLALNQAFLLVATMPVLAVLRPSAADLLLAVLILGSAAIVMQLRGRATLLVSQGYGYEDLRAAVLAERRQRAEEAEIMRSPLAPAVRGRWRVPGLAIALGLALVAHAATRPTLSPLLRVELILGVGLVAVPIIIEVAGSPRRRRGVGSLVAWFWVGASGRWLFDRLARGRVRPTGLVPPTPQVSVPGWESIPPHHRATAAAVQQVIADLEARAEEYRRRERAIDEALTRAAWRTPTDSEEEPGSADRAKEALARRRRELVAEMRESRDRARADRERIEMALENLRLQLGRLSTGLGSATGVESDLSAARALLEEPAPAAPAGGSD